MTVIATFTERLGKLVSIDSPSHGVEQEQVTREIAEWLEPAGCTFEWVTEPDGPGRSAVLTLPGNGQCAVSLLGHTDTVFGPGEAAARPFTCAGERCFGPGVADMKGGLVLAAMVVEEFARRAEADRPFSELRLLICADEEVRLRGPAVAERARGSAAALVFECARENGDLVSSRKGAVWRTLELTGRPAHAGADTARGRSAVSALASEIIRIEALKQGRPEMTSVITTVAGGDAANTVPGHARATIDIRSSDPADLDHAVIELDRPSGHDGVTSTIVDRGTWPPMGHAGALVARALELAAAHGLEIGEQLSGGVSDGCWTSAWDIPTIDGLGPCGGRDHTPEEWIEVRTVPARIAFVADLVTAAM